LVEQPVKKAIRQERLKFFIGKITSEPPLAQSQPSMAMKQRQLSVTTA